MSVVSLDRDVRINAPLVPGHADAGNGHQAVVDEICGLDWRHLSSAELTNVAWAYYFFSKQFCQSVDIARVLFPDDAALEALDAGERNTDNLSPYDGVVGPGEKVDHDEFMRRTLMLTPIEPERRRRLEIIGQSYFDTVYACDAYTRATSLATYEDGGLESVFTAVLQAPHWDTDLLKAFRHFLVGHVALDSDPDHGHGALCRHIAPTKEVVTLWRAFRDSLIASAPGLVPAAGK
jgi:hypothetical protein